METLTAMDPTTQMCRIVLRDIGNRKSAFNGNNRKRYSQDEDKENQNPEPKRLHGASDSGDSGFESSVFENIIISDDDDDLISEMIYSEVGNVSYAVKCNVIENSAVGSEETDLGGQNITAFGNEIITVDGLKTYLQLESCPRTQVTEDGDQVPSEHEKDPSTNNGITTLVGIPGIETESDEGVSSRESAAATFTFEIDVPVSPAPIPTPMPKQHKEKRWRYRGLNQNLRRIFGEYRKIDTAPKTLLTLKQENGAAEHKFPNSNYELMGRKPSPRFVALTSALKVARGKRDHRNAWVHTFHVDLCKMSLLNRLMSDFADKRRHYEMLCEAIRGTAVNITKSLDHCIVEETSSVDPNCTWQELRSNAIKSYMSPGGQGHEQRLERLALRRRTRAQKRRRKCVEQSRKGLEFDPDLFFSKGEAGLQFQLAES